MPNEKVLSEKQAIVAELADKLKRASAGIFVDFTGTTVATDTEMRREMGQAGVEYSVVKNTLTRFAANQTGFEALDPYLNGPTALALSYDDPVAVAKVVYKYASKKDSTLKIKVGFADGKLIEESQIKALAALPPREELLAKVLGTMIAPASGLATVLNANIRGLAVVLNAIAEKKSGDAA